MFPFIYRCPANLLPGIFIVVFTILYALLVTKSRRIDHYEKKKTGYIFLQESTPPGHQLYAVVIDTGFRAPARFSAKVVGSSWEMLCVCGRMWAGVSDSPTNTRFGESSAFPLSLCPAWLAQSYSWGTHLPHAQASPRPGRSAPALLPFPPAPREAARSGLCLSGIWGL